MWFFISISVSHLLDIIFFNLIKMVKINLIPLTGKPFHSNETGPFVTAQLLQYYTFYCTKADHSKYKHIYLRIPLSAPFQLYIQHRWFSFLARQMVIDSYSTVKGKERHRYFEEFTWEKQIIIVKSLILFLLLASTYISFGANN